MPDEKKYPHNYKHILVEGTLIYTTITFIDSNTIIPIFIDTFSKNIGLVGIANSLRVILTIIPQIILGFYIAKISSLPNFIRGCMFFFRSLPLLVIPALYLIQSNNVLVFVFLLIFSIMWVGEGIIAIPWLDLIGRTIGGNVRGKMIGLQQFLGGIGSVAGGFLIKIILSNVNISNNMKFSILFGIAGVMGFFSVVAILQVKDKERVVEQNNQNMLVYFKGLLLLVNKNKEFLKMLIIQMLINIPWTLIPLLILFCKRTFGLSDIEVSKLVFAQIAGTLAAGLIWGNISHKLGNKPAILVSHVIGFAISVIALLSLVFKPIGVSEVVLIGMVFVNGIYTGSWLGFLNHVLEITEGASRPSYLVLNSIIGLPLVLFYSAAAFTADIWGFIPLFIASLVSLTAAFVFSLKLEA